MTNPGQIFSAALPFFLFLFVLLVVFRHPGAGKVTRCVGGLFACPLLFVALTPRLTLGDAATPGDIAVYYALVGGGLLLLTLILGRSNLE